MYRMRHVSKDACVECIRRMPLSMHAFFDACHRYQPCDCILIFHFQGCLNTEVLNMVFSESDELSMAVVPLDSTAITLQQAKKHKTGKLIRKRNNRRLKANRSSCTSLKAKIQTYFPQPSLTRSKSFTRSGGSKIPIKVDFLTFTGEFTIKVFFFEIFHTFFSKFPPIFFFENFFENFLGLD